MALARAAFESASVRRSVLEEEKKLQWQLPVPSASSIDYLKNEAVGMISFEMTPP